MCTAKPEGELNSIDNSLESKLTHLSKEQGGSRRDSQPQMVSVVSAVKVLPLKLVSNSHLSLMLSHSVSWGRLSG